MCIIFMFYLHNFFGIPYATAQYLPKGVSQHTLNGISQNYISFNYRQGEVSFLLVEK